MLKGSCHCGAASWSFDGIPESVTACNCTVCRRYGVLWAYDYDGEKIRIAGPMTSYKRADASRHSREILFCPTCGCVVAWRGLGQDENGRRRIAVNVRLTEPTTIADLPIDHFDGLESFDDLPRDGRTVKDMWF